MTEPRILFEDADIVVVDKPAGWVVHPAGSGEHRALDAWLKERLGHEVFLVHRIDRQTSGVLLVAKNEKAQGFLKAQFQKRDVRKIYRAFVYGVTDERGIIDKPIGSTRGGLGPRSAKNPYGTLRDATTIYRSITHNREATYVEIFPKTGRTHQIRVHFAAIQHPVICDELYAPGRPKLLGFERLALHALSLSFVHPSSTSSGQASGNQVTFEAPLPEDFVRAERLIF